MPDNLQAGHGFQPVNMVAALVEGDISCRRCNQNLNGLPVDGRCPQCGAPIGMTLNGELLRYAEPSWVRMLRNGCVVMLTGMGAVFLVVVLTIIAVVTTHSQSFTMRISSMGNFFATAIATCGLWMLTAPQPGLIAEDEFRTTRKVIRIVAIVGLVLGVGNILGSLSDNPVWVTTWAGWVVIVVSLFSLVGVIAQLQYIEQLALRIPDVAISERADLLKLILPATQAIVLILSAISRFIFAPTSPTATPPATPTMPPPAMIGLGCLSIVFGLAALVMTVFYIIMLVKLTIELGRQAQLAAENAAAVSNIASPSVPQTNL